jgi:hypothetical protein
MFGSIVHHGSRHGVGWIPAAATASSGRRAVSAASILQCRMPRLAHTSAARKQTPVLQPPVLQLFDE